MNIVGGVVTCVVYIFNRCPTKRVKDGVLEEP